MIRYANPGKGVDNVSLYPKRSLHVIQNFDFTADVFLYPDKFYQTSARNVFVGSDPGQSVSAWEAGPALSLTTALFRKGGRNK